MEVDDGEAVVADVDVVVVDDVKYCVVLVEKVVLVVAVSENLCNSF